MTTKQKKLVWHSRPRKTTGKYGIYRSWRTLCGRYMVLEHTLLYGNGPPFYEPYVTTDCLEEVHTTVNRQGYKRLGDRWRTYRSLQAAKRVCEQDWRAKRESKAGKRSRTRSRPTRAVTAADDR